MHWVTRNASYSLILFALCGCGDGDDASPGGSAAESENFIGTWQYTSGTSTTTCQGTSQTEPMTGNVTITKGSTSDLLITDPQCATKLDVNGNTANAQSGQSCTVQEMGATGTRTVSSLVFTTSDGKTGHVSGTFNGVVMVFGQTVTCTVSVTADLQKL